MKEEGGSKILSTIILNELSLKYVCVGVYGCFKEEFRTFVTVTKQTCSYTDILKPDQPFHEPKNRQRIYA